MSRPTRKQENQVRKILQRNDRRSEGNRRNSIRVTIQNFPVWGAKDAKLLFDPVILELYENEKHWTEGNGVGNGVYLQFIYT